MKIVLAVKFTRRYRNEYAYKSHDYHYFHNVDVEQSDPMSLVGQYAIVPVEDMTVDNFAIAKISDVFSTDPSGMAAKYVVGTFDASNWRQRQADAARKAKLQAEIEARIEERGKLVMARNLAVHDGKLRELLARYDAIGE